MPHAFKDSDEKCNFLCVCLKSATENGGNIDRTMVGNTFTFNAKKVGVLLASVKKTGNDICKGGDGTGDTENNDDASSAENAEVSKKRKTEFEDKEEKDQTPKGKKGKKEKGT